MPEPDGTAKKLGGGNQERRIPENVMKRGAYPPGPQGMKEDMARVCRLVGVVLIKEVAPRVRVHDSSEFFPECSDLLGVEDLNPGEVPILAKKTDLLVRKAKSFPLFCRLRPGK